MFTIFLFHFLMSQSCKLSYKQRQYCLLVGLTYRLMFDIRKISKKKFTEHNLKHFGKALQVFNYKTVLAEQKGTCDITRELGLSE